MREIKLVAVGSKSAHKLEAIRHALDHFEVNADVVSCHVASGVNEQPVGLEETMTGALNRAQRALESLSGKYAGNAMGIGIESGLLLAGNSAFDIAVIAAVIPKQGVFYGTSAGIEFPMLFVKEAETLGFSKTTVGSIIASHLGGDATDPHAILTGGQIKRNDTLAEAIQQLFARIIKATKK